jgi:hypothetical protein
MLTRISLGLALLAATPVWGQLESTPFEIPTTPSDEARMLTPPPISNSAYPTSVGSQMRSNYLAAGVIFSTAYNDNVLAGGGTTTVDDVIYSILPTITFDQVTPRRDLKLMFTPGFTVYQHTSALNAANQSASLNFQYRLSEHMTVSLNDFFQKSSSVFNQPYPSSGGPISGSVQTPPSGVIAPYAEQLSNITNAGINYQFAENSMIGASGIVTETNYPSPAEAAGLYNSNSVGGSAFYNRRMSSTQYAGLTYQYLRSDGNPVQSQENSANADTSVQTNSILPFYTIYLNPTLSISLSGGAQFYDATQSSLPAVRSWTPSAAASIGWQRSNTNLATSYSRTVSAAVGLPGAFESTSVNASARWQITRDWSASGAGSYSTNKNVTPSFPLSSPGGHSISGTASVQHSLSEHFKIELGYGRLHQSYSGIAAISNAPNTDRVFISISYQVTRPVGR